MKEANGSAAAGLAAGLWLIGACLLIRGHPAAGGQAAGAEPRPVPSGHTEAAASRQPKQEAL